MSRKKTDKRINLENKSYIQIIPLKRTEHLSVHDQVINEYLHASRKTDNYIIVHSEAVPDSVEEVSKAASSLLKGYDTVHKIHESKMAVLQSRITIFEASTDSAIVREPVRSRIDELKESAKKLEDEIITDVYKENVIKEFRENSERLKSCIAQYYQFLDKTKDEYNSNRKKDKDGVKIQVIEA